MDDRSRRILEEYFERHPEAEEARRRLREERQGPTGDPRTMVQQQLEAAGHDWRLPETEAPSE